jgi:Methane oxygenase PmoA
VFSGDAPVLTMVGSSAQIYVHGLKAGETSRAASAEFPHRLDAVFGPYCLLTGEGPEPAITVLPASLWANRYAAEMDFIARRGRYSVGYRQDAIYKCADGTAALTTSLTVRAVRGPSEGAVFDLSFLIECQDTEAIEITDPAAPMLRILINRTLTGAGGGLMRTAEAGWNPASAEPLAPLPARTAFVSATGVPGGRTAGLAVLDHPVNSGYPALWNLEQKESGALLTATWAAAAPLKIFPGESLQFKVRIQTYCGYVDDGWLHARAEEFAHEVVKL